MIAAARRQKTGAPRLSPALLILQSHFQRHFHRHGAGISKKDTLQPRRHVLQQSFGQIHRRGVRQAAEHHMRHATGLGTQGRKQARMIVAMRRRPPGRHAVDQFPSVSENDAIIMTAPGCAQGRQCHGGGIGMPDRAVVARHQVRCHLAARPLCPVSQFLRQRGQCLSQTLPCRAIQARQTRQLQHWRVTAGSRQPRAQHPEIVGQNAGFIFRAHCGRLRGNQGQSRQTKPPVAQGGQRKQRMIQRAQTVAAHQQHWQIQGGHQIQHVLPLIERHAQPARAFQQQKFRRAVQALPMLQDILGQFCRFQALALARRGQMRRSGQRKTAQHRCGSQARHRRQISHSRRVHPRISLLRGIFLPCGHTGLHGLHGLSRHPRKAQRTQQGGCQHGFAHIRAGSAHKYGAKRAAPPPRAACGISAAHECPPPAPALQSWQGLLQCPVRAW